MIMEELEHGKGKTETLILSKKDEQERVQKKTFTNWVNTYLIHADPPYKIDDICERVKDGVCLIHLLEAMTGEKLRHENPRNMQRIHKLANINTALEFLKGKKIKLVNINATDIADGKPAIVLGLIWTVILFFQIEEQEEVLFGTLGDDFKGKGNAKKALLGWVNKTIGEKYDLNVTDFGPSWRDGKAFNALVHNIDPSLIDWNSVQNKDNKSNLLEAFKQAEELGIPHILDPQDVDVEKPDEKSIMTYITQFLKSYPDGTKGIDEEIVATKRMQEESAIREREEEERRRKAEEEEAEKQRLKAEEEIKRQQEEAERKRREEEAERKRREEEAERQRREEIERKRKEEEQRQKEEAERRKREEEERKRQEEERKRKEEEERKRQEEERKRKEEEERKRQEEERRRKEEERKRKEEEERKRKEEERLRKEEEERKRKEEEERKRKEEEERKRKEEERLRKEEEERKRKEEEERKRKQEEERKRKEEEERQRKLEEEKSNRRKLTDQLKNLDNWVEDLQKYLDSPLDCDNDSICSYLNNLNSLLEDKDPIEDDLAGLKDDIKSGLCGADYIKPFLSDIQSFEKKLKETLSRANSVKAALSQNCTQLKSCEKNIDNVFNWIEDSNNMMKDIDHAASRDECDSKLDDFRGHLSEEQKAINSLKEAKEMYSKLKALAPKNLNDKNLKMKLDNLEEVLKKSTENQRAIDKSLKEFDNAVAKANDYQKDFEKKLSNIGPQTNDVNKLKQQLEKIEKLKRSHIDGERIIEDVIEKEQNALQKTGDLHAIQQKIQSDTENCEKQWHKDTDALDKLKKEITDKLEKCEEVLNNGNKVEGWLKEKENQLKAYKSPCESMSQKEAQIEDLKKLLDEIELESPSIDKYLSELEELSVTDPGIARRLNATKQQRDNLIQNVKDAIASSEAKVKNHEDFNDKLDIAEEWLDIAKALKADATSKEKPGNIEELQRRKDLIDQLLNSKQNGEKLIKEAVAAGECTAKDTSSKGKEDILNVLRGLNKDFIQVFDGLGPAKQAIETKLTKMSNVNKDLETLGQWAEEFEHKLSNVPDGDIDKLKELCDDAQSKMYLADNLLNQAKALNDQDLEHSAEQMKSLIKRNLENAQQMYGAMRENQRAYNDFTKGCSNIDNWINDIERKMSRCAEATSSNPEDMNLRLKSLEKLADEIKSKRNDLEKINAQGNELSWSNPSKSDEINSLLEALNDKYQRVLENVESIDQSIKDDIKDQNDFESALHKANRWLNDTTQQLLKYSDTKQCSPSHLNEFSKKVEDIVDKVPFGEDIINSAIAIGQQHIDHLRRKSSQSVVTDKDSKRINDLDKNWNDFKKQLDQVNRNLQKVKDNLGEFDMLKDRVEEYIEDKEKYMRTPPSTEGFKYILDEMNSFGKDIEQLQKKANDVSSSLSNSDAPMIAKELTERYNNLKRAMERRRIYFQKAELARAKKLENDWASYKNALNACEKWIVDTGFRIIDHDFSAASPEDAQVKLDECAYMCDEIRKFKAEVDKIIDMGKQVAEEIVQSRSSGKNESLIPQHSESEIETDADHLENSYRNVLENSNQTKSRLDEQLNNWRKYRDVVQNNDKYLTTDLVEWWREKKYVDPMTVEDVNLNISQAEAIFQDLLARQAEMKLSKSSCQSALLGSGSRKSFSVSDLSRNNSSTTPLSRLAQSVEEGLEKNIEEIKKYLPKLEKTKQEWKSFEKEIEEFENWVKDKENTFESKIHKPSMKSSSLNDDQRVEAERLKREIDANEKYTNQLLEKARILGKRQFNPLLQRIEDLKRNLKKLLERRDEEIDAVDFVKKESVSCQNSVMQYNYSETIATQTPPETCTVSTSTLPIAKKAKSVAIETKPLPTPVPQNNYGLRNSGGNRGLSKMLYPYCCTSDLINQRAHLDFVHGAVLRDKKIDQNDRPKPTRMMASKVRNGAEESIRRNFVAAQTFN